MKKRILSLLLALCMTFSLLPAATPVLAAGESLFERYIPIAQVYSAMATPTGVAVGKNFLFQWGTQLVDENYDSAMFAKIINRKDYQGHFLKVGYLGTFGSLDQAAMKKALNLDDTAYQIAMGTQAPSGNYQKTIDKSSIIVTVDLYDANQKLVQNISPACAILAVGAEGEFLTYSERGGKRCSLFFSTQDNLCKITDDRKNIYSIHFTPAYTWLADKSVADGLLGSQGTQGIAQPQGEYKFIQYPELNQERPQYMTNNILSATEFIDPFGTYYQVGYGAGLDPEVKNKIENVVDYSEYGRVLSPGETQRSILTADGTLYGVNNLTCEKKVLATGVKQAGKAHYMTTDGTVKETDSGKVVATNCAAFAEHRFAEVIGVLKTDGTLYLGYTYLSQAPGNYEKGLQKMTVDGGKTDKFKAVVACGAATEDDRFFRWSETVTPMGYDEVAFAQGFFIPYNDYKLSLELVTDKAARVFPYEYFTEQESTAQDAVTGFVVNEDGYVWAFGLHRQFQLSDGKGNGAKLGMIKHIFPIYQTLGKFGDNANFVAFLSENDNKVKALMANHCTNNRPEAGELPVAYLSDVPGGYKGVDGYTYCFDMEASKSFTMKPTAFHYLNDKREVFHAMNTSTNPISNMDLLPNVARSSYRADGKSSNVVLLERTDGSMWMTRTYSKVSAADAVAKLGGWENTNAIQITQPTNKVSGRCDYVDLVGGDASTVVNRGPVDAPSTEPKTTFMTDPHYVNVSEYQAEKKYRDGEKFVLLVCSLGCGWCKRLKAGLPATLSAANYSIYGTSDNDGVLNFYWDFVSGSTVGTPYAIIVNGKDDVEVVSAIHSQAEMSAVIQKAKSKGIPSAVGTGSTATTTPTAPETPATVLPIPADAQDQSGSKSLSKLSQTEMAALIKGAPDTLSEDPFQTQPSVTAPYAAGQVKNSALQTAAARLTMLRRLAGLPAVELDATLNQQAQYGAVLLAASEFSHTPAQPAGMSNDFYQKGYAATSTSNIHYSGTGGSAISTGSYVLAKSTDGFMDDSDMYNIDRVGHRRWQLNPTMKKVGFGLAVGKSGSWTNQYVAEQVMDTSGPAVDYDFISWPASGNFPNDLSGFNKDTAWSVTLNPRKYATPSAGAVSVKLTRLADGKVWTFSGSESYAAADSGKYFNVSTSGSGVANCIIFRPDAITKYEGTYVVEVNGLTNSARQPATLRYGVIFFDSNDPDDSVPAASSIPTSGTAYPSTQTVDLDGKKVEFQMYALRDAAGNPTNYVKVRDLALALNGTAAQFSVGWDQAAKVVDLAAKTSYTANGSENSTPFSGERAYTVPQNPTNVNGVQSDLQAIVLTDDAGGAYTYYQLRDLGKKLGFNVDWSMEKGVFIETGKPYSGT